MFLSLTFLIAVGVGIALFFWHLPAPGYAQRLWARIKKIFTKEEAAVSTVVATAEAAVMPTGPKA